MLDCAPAVWRRSMDRSHPSESFRGLLLRHRGRSGLTQRDLAARIGASARSLQDWEAGVKFPTADRLQALIGALLEVGGLADGREESEARELWAAAERKAARMRTPFDAEWFTRLLATHAQTHEAPQAPSSDAWRRNLSVAPVAVAGMASIASGGAVARDFSDARPAAAADRASGEARDRVVPQGRFSDARSGRSGASIANDFVARSLFCVPALSRKRVRGSNPRLQV